MAQSSINVHLDSSEDPFEPCIDELETDSGTRFKVLRMDRYLSIMISDQQLTGLYGCIAEHLGRIDSKADEPLNDQEPDSNRTLGLEDF